MGFNVVKGWPLGEALEDSAIPFPGLTIEAGMALRKVAHPTLTGQFAVRPVSETDSTFVTAQVLFALDSSGAFDVIEANRLPFIINTAVVETDRVSGTFTTIGEIVYADTTAGNNGSFTDTVADNPPCGRYDGATTLENINGDQEDAIRIIWKS